MAKQTFTTGQVLTAAQMTSLQQTAMGGGSATAKTASYTLVAADAGTTVIMNSASATAITVNTSLFSAGDTIFIQNIGAGVSTITAGTATVNTASSLALAQYESGNLYFTAAGTSIFSKADGAAAGGGGANWSLLNAGGTAMTGAQNITVSGISGANQIMVLVDAGGVTAGANYSVRYRINTDSGSNYTWMYFTPALTEGGYYTQDGIVQPDMGATTASRLYSYLLISGGNASGVKNFQTYAYTTGVTTGKAFMAGGYWNNSATVSSITIRNENGANWTNGTIYVYTSAS